MPLETTSASPARGSLCRPRTPLFEAERRPELLSLLWVFAMLNYLYADVLSLMDPVLAPQWQRGEVDGLTITRPFLLGAAVLMEIPIAMVLLSRVLPDRSNRLANLVAGALKTLAVAGSLAVGHPAGHYVFFASIEIVTTVAIVVFAWRWPAIDPHRHFRTTEQLTS